MILHSIYHSLPLFSSKSRPAIDNCHQQQMNTYFSMNPRSTMLTDDDNVQLTNSYRLLSLERNKVFEFVYSINREWLMFATRYTRWWMQLLDIFWTHRIDRWTKINSLQHLHGFSSLSLWKKMKCVCLNYAAVGQDDHRGEDSKFYETFGAKIHAFLKVDSLHFFRLQLPA